ncbi:MAG TPA: hypothetical protein VGB24_00985 [Longimicrobium sp.]|jgi:hypothetical protein|uniref:hypothetical protein n=1 Tax=Longimicrobium sp. TaxID=2029185 RepID=UPI002ED7C728
MHEDPIVEEVHRARREIMAGFNNDLHAYCEHLRELTEVERQRGRVIISTPFRRSAPQHETARTDAA